MNMTATLDDKEIMPSHGPGAQLAALRAKNGYSPEYVAGKLHLRLQLLELLEADDYTQMPQPVFIKGYFRAYAKLLGISADPFIEAYIAISAEDKKVERTLWQSKKLPKPQGKRTSWRPVLLLVGLVIVIVSLIWQKNKDFMNETQMSSNKQEERIAQDHSEQKKLDQTKSVQAHSMQRVDAESVIKQEANESHLKHEQTHDKAVSLLLPQVDKMKSLFQADDKDMQNQPKAKKRLKKDKIAKTEHEQEAASE